VDVLGNPLNVVNELYEGVTSFITEPLKEGGEVRKGTTTLISNSLGAMTTFTTKITGTISSYLMIATFDKEFIEDKKESK